MSSLCIKKWTYCFKDIRMLLANFYSCAQLSLDSIYHYLKKPVPFQISV